MGRHPATAERCIEVWIRWNIDHGVLPKSIQSYRMSAARAIKIFKANNKETLPYKWKETDLYWIKNYWESEHMGPDGSKCKPLAVKTVKVYMAVISMLAAHFNNNVGKEARIRYAQDMRPNTDWLPYDDMVKVLDFEMDPLQRAAINLMACMGLRRVEIIRLKFNMIDWKNSRIDVDGKAHKKRTVPFHRDTEAVLKAWMEEREALRRKAMAYARTKHMNFIDTDAVFVFKKSQGIYAFSEKGTGFDKRVKDKLTKQTGVKVKNHSLRRTFGRESHYRGDMSMLDLSIIYGHSSERMTADYIGADQERIKEAMKKVPF
jgi:integrase